MYRIFRRGCVLACAGALLFLSSVNAAEEPDYVLEETQVTIASASAGPGSVGSKISEFDALESAIAVAPGEHRALVVWSADETATIAGTGDEEDPIYVVDNEFEIYAQVVDAGSLVAIGAKQRVSVMGYDMEYVDVKRRRYAARNPAVVWNPVAEEFLIVWEGDDNAAPLVDDEFEIFGQRADINGKLVGGRVRISAMGDDNAADPQQRALYGARRPSVAVNPISGHYVVVWQGDDDTAPLVDDETEIFGRYLDSTATPLSGQFRISFAGDDGESIAMERVRYAASNPQIAHNDSSGFYVVWQADDNQNGMMDDENEVFLQRLGPSFEVDEDCSDPLCPTYPVPPGPAVRVSQMGSDGDAAFDALSPALAVDGVSGAMLVVWHGDTLEGALIDDEFEVHGRLFDMNAVPLTPQFRVSTMGVESATDPAVRAASTATDVSVAWGSPLDDHFLVAWRGDTPEGSLVDNEFEIFAALVEPDGDIFEDEIRVSVQGADDEDKASERTKLAAENPAIAHSNGNFITIWNGDTSSSGGSDDRMQIFGQRVAATSTKLELGIVKVTPKRLVPNPVEIVIGLTNSGEIVADNNSIVTTLSEDFPLTWKGCQNVTVDSVCEIGNIAPDETVEVTLVLATDHIEMGDTQGTVVTLSTHSDTALITPVTAQRQFFVGVTLEIEGGSGAAFWLLLLGGFALLPAIRRRAIQS